MIIRLPKRVRQHYEEKGLGRTLIWVVLRLAASVASFFYQALDFDLWIIESHDISENECTHDDQYRVRQLQEEGLPEIEKEFGKVVAEDFARRIESASCYIIADQDGIVGYGWFSPNLVKNEGNAPFVFDIWPKKGVMYIYDSFVLPHKRRRGANTRLEQHKLLEAKKAGFRKVLVIVDKDNVAQRKILGRHSMCIDGRISYRRYLWHVVKNTSALEKFCRVP